MDELSKVRVFCRMRPFIKREKDMGNLTCPLEMNGDEVNIHRDKTYNFDRVFDQTSSQSDIFNDICKKDISDFIEGFNVTQFAYGQSGCLHPNTEVMMFDGSAKKAKYIKIGDVLMGDDSRERNVLELFEGEQKMYEIIPEKGESYIVNEDHVLTLMYVNPLKRHRDMDYVNPLVQWCDRHVRPIDIMVREYLQRSKMWKKSHLGMRCKVDFNKKDVPIDPYMMGLWLGAGCSYFTTITVVDNNIKEYVYEFAKKINCQVVCNSNNEICLRDCYELQNNPFLDFLKKYNLINNKHIPPVYKYNDREFRLSLLAGLLDTHDGVYNHKECLYELNIFNKTLFNDIIWLSRSLGFGCYETPTHTGSIPIYRCTIKGESLHEIPCKIRSNKSTKTMHGQGSSLYVGISVKPLEKGRYNGFRLDGNHRFLLGDFTCTHNSGKTFSMMGVNGDSRLEGIIPRSIEEIFNIITKKPEGWFFEIEVSYLEIYMERINDLINTDKKNLQIRQSNVNGVFVEDLTRENVGSIEEVYDLIKRGDSARKVTSTKLNNESSRSHSILSIYLNQTCPDKRQISSQLNLVDLAGSERADKTKATGEVLKQGALINLSLTVLSQVINALSIIEAKGRDINSTPIPYRDSKLTRLLQGSFGGNSKTSLIIHVSPHINNIDESISTLEFGKRTKLIKNKAIKTIRKSVEQLEQELESLQLDYDNLYLSIEKGEVRQTQSPTDVCTEKIGWGHVQKEAKEILKKLEDKSKLAKRISSSIIRDNSYKIDQLDEEINDLNKENTRLKKEIESFAELFYEMGVDGNRKDTILNTIKNMKEENVLLKQENYAISQDLMEKANRLSKAELECFRHNISLTHVKEHKNKKIRVKVRSKGKLSN